MSIDIEKILSLVGRPEEINLSTLSELSWFNVTWQCSYIWIYSILVYDDATFEEFFAQAYKADPTRPNLPLDRWLPHCKFAIAGKEDLVMHINHARSDLAEAKAEDGCEFIGVQLPLDEASLSNIHGCYLVRGVERPCNKQQVGPTNIFIWRSGNWFHYCEIHNES